MWGTTSDFVVSIFLPLFLSCSVAKAAFSNYNSVLIGERAAGMGGAFTALTDDPAASSFYNPASLARTHGSSLSASVNLYNKTDANYEGSTAESGALRVNQGTIEPVPAASGTVYTFGNFAVGLSIVAPDVERYAGLVRATPSAESYLNETDSSLWIGGSLAVNTSPDEALGLTMYYTSRTLIRSLYDQALDGAIATVTNEEKVLRNNSLVYQLGYFNQLSPQWSFGASYRFKSLPVHNRGDYYRSAFSTSAAPETPTSARDQGGDFFVPAKATLGVAYSRAKHSTLSLDVSFFDGARYLDFESLGFDEIRHRPVWNTNIGYERFLRTWLLLRGGFFTNYSSHPPIADAPASRTGDHVNMYGVSLNFAIVTSDTARVTLGGYYTGGQGSAVELLGGELTKIPFRREIFSFLAGTSYHF